MNIPTKIFKNVLFGSLVLTFLACSVLTPKPTPNAADIEGEEQAVYSFFVEGSQGTVLILEDTATDYESDNNLKQTMEYVESGMKDVSKETLDNFLARNAQTSHLSSDMNLGAKYILLTDNELSKITSQPNWNETLHQKYPDSSGYVVFSHVGFNNSLDQALVYVGISVAPSMGYGTYYLMEKQNGQWVVKERIQVWVS